MKDFLRSCFFIFQDLLALPVHWYHRSLSVIIIYHKFLHIAIDFLYNFY